MIGTLHADRSSPSTISGTAGRGSSVLTVTRTSSLPALAKRRHLAHRASTSAVSVLVIDCTTTGWQEPTRTRPMRVVTVWRREVTGMREI